MESMPAPQQNCCGRNHQSAPIRTAFHKKVNLIVAPVSKRKSPSAKLKRVTFKLMILPLSLSLSFRSWAKFLGRRWPRPEEPLEHCEQRSTQKSREINETGMEGTPKRAGALSKTYFSSRMNVQRGAKRPKCVAHLKNQRGAILFNIRLYLR